MFLFSPDIIEAYWMEAPLANGGFKWWLAWLSFNNLTTMWGENGQLTQSKIIATQSEAEVKLQAKLVEKHGKGYRQIGRYDTSQHLWSPSPAINLPAFPPTAKPHAYNESPDFEIKFEKQGQTKERMVLKEVRGSFLKLESVFRLEHYTMLHHPAILPFPTWQTLFTSRDDAVAVVRDVIEKREVAGMVASGDLGALVRFVPLEVFLTPETLVWDF